VLPASTRSLFFLSVTATPLPTPAGHFSSSVGRSSFSLFASQYCYCSSSADRCSSSARRSLLLFRASIVAAPPPPVATPPPRADRCSKSWCSYSMEGMVNASHRRSSSEPPPLPTVGQAHPHRRVDIALVVGLARPLVLPTSVPLSPRHASLQRRPRRMRKRRESTLPSASLLPIPAFAHPHAHISRCATVSLQHREYFCLNFSSCHR
jgi:hypothetical protein